MTWREQLKTGASFRGVPFATVDAEARVGRRSVPHEYPQRDLPYVEDLGRRARVFVVEAYVIGDDYMARRDALMAAIEQPGAGELVHPRWGTLQVAVQDYVSVKESTREGGVARFSISFIESGQNTFPKTTQDTVAEVDAASNVVEDAAAADFASGFDVEGLNAIAEQSLKTVQRDVNELLATARRVTDVSAAAALVGSVGGISSNLDALLRSPLTLVANVRGVYSQLIQSVLRPLGAFADFGGVFQRNARPSSSLVAAARPGSTSARLLANESARADLQRRLALTNQARALAVALQANDSGIGTVARALEQRNRLLEQLDIELEENDPPAEVAAGLVRLRAAVTRDVAERAELLRRASTFKPAAVLPALVIAHRVYQDAGRTDELVLRNGIRHPAFVPAVALEVLQ